MAAWAPQLRLCARRPSFLDRRRAASLADRLWRRDVEPIGSEQPEADQHADLDVDAVHEQTVEHVVNGEHDQAAEDARQNRPPEGCSLWLGSHQRTAELAEGESQQ